MAGIEQMDTVTNSTEPSSARRQIEAYLATKGMLASNPRFGASVSQLLDANMRDPSILPNIVGAPEPMSTPRGDRGGDGGSRNAPPNVGRSAPSGSSAARDVEGSNPTIPSKGGASTGSEPNAPLDQRSSAPNAANDSAISGAIARAVDEPVPPASPGNASAPPTPAPASPAPPAPTDPELGQLGGGVNPMGDVGGGSSDVNLWPMAAGLGAGGATALATQILGRRDLPTAPPVHIGLPGDAAGPTPLPPGTAAPNMARPISAVPVDPSLPTVVRPGATPIPIGGGPSAPPPPAVDPLQSALERAVPSAPPSAPPVADQLIEQRGQRPMQPGPTETSPRLRNAAPARDPQRIADVLRQAFPGMSVDEGINLLRSIGRVGRR